MSRNQPEHDLQVTIIQWCRLNPLGYKSLHKIYSNPNQGYGGDDAKRRGRKMKAEGARAGVLDLFLPVARGGYHGAYIELKIGDNDLSPEQTAFVKDMITEGYKCAMCKSLEQFQNFIKFYYSLNND